MITKNTKIKFSGYEYEGYRMIWDIHTHTTYSHGKGTIEENVNAALALGLEEIAITDHGPGHLTYGIDKALIPEMRAEIDRLQALHPEIRIRLGVEANVTAVGNHLDIAPKEFADYDYVHAGYHYGIRNGNCMKNFMNWSLPGNLWGKELLLANTEMTVAALYENNIKILTHPGDKGPFDMHALAKACEETDTLMEISTWHSHLTEDELLICKKYDVKFVISSDAHVPGRVGDAAVAIKRAFKAGIAPERIVNIKKFK